MWQPQQLQWTSTLTNKQTAPTIEPSLSKNAECRNESRPFFGTSMPLCGTLFGTWETLKTHETFIWNLFHLEPWCLNIFFLSGTFESLWIFMGNLSLEPWDLYVEPLSVPFLLNLGCQVPGQLPQIFIGWDPKLLKLLGQNYLRSKKKMILPISPNIEMCEALLQGLAL